jgi:hypothetical protein
MNILISNFRKGRMIMTKLIRIRIKFNSKLITKALNFTLIKVK